VDILSASESFRDATNKEGVGERGEEEEERRERLVSPCAFPPHPQVTKKTCLYH
jgi:hypothetical protein